MKKYHSVSIIVPVYNEENTIAKIIERVKKADTLGLDKEIIVVNDGSTDKTAKILDKMKGKSIKVYHQPYNKGKGAALRHGFEMARGDIILIQDADLEYEPSDYQIMLDKMAKKNVKVVYGSRRLKKHNVQYSGVSFFLGGLALTYFTNWLYGTNLTDEPTGYKMFDAKLLKSIKLDSKRFEFCPEITAKISKLGYIIHEVPIHYYPRHANEGKKIKIKDFFEAIWVLIKYRIQE